MLRSTLRVLYLATLLVCTLSVTGNVNNGDDFFNCCRTGDVECTKRYIGNGFLVSERDSKGNTGIVIASGRGQNKVIQILLSHGANVEDYSLSGIFEGKSALSWACSQGRAETVALLIEEGANPNAAPKIGVFAGKSPLMWAASQGRTEVVKLLTSMGVLVDFTSSTGNFKGKSALMWASSQGRVEAVRVLLEAGAAVNAVDSDGVSALMWAAGSEAAGEDSHRKGLLESANKGHVEVLQQLLKYKAELDMRDKDGITAIMFACYHGHLGAVQVLLNAGSNADYRSKEGKTALQLARNAGHDNIARVIERGPTFMSSSLDDLRVMTACGWLLSVLRAPLGTGVLVLKVHNGEAIPLHQQHSLRTSCNELRVHGLDYSMYDLLTMVHGSSVQEALEHTGLRSASFAAFVRGRMQLTTLYEKFRDRLENDSRYFPSSKKCVADHWQANESMIP